MPTLAEHIAEMPPAIRKAFVEAGWRPGVIRSQSIESFGVEALPVAKEILNELSGIEVRPTTEGGSVRALRIRFDPNIVRGYEDEVRALANALRVSLFPLADVGNGVAILLLAETGELLLLGYAAPGMYLAGKSFTEGVAAILQGSAMSPLLIENAPDRIFQNPDLELNGTSILIVPIEGLRAAR